MEPEPKKPDVVDEVVESSNSQMKKKPDPVAVRSAAPPKQQAE